MEAPDLKIEFQKQLKDAEVKIAEAEKNLKQLNEYKTKLLGGLETIELLLPKSEGKDGVLEPSAVPPADNVES